MYEAGQRLLYIDQPNSDHMKKTNSDNCDSGEKNKNVDDIAKKYLDSAGVIIVALDADANIVFLNKKGCEIIGCERGNFIGKNWFDACLPPEEATKVKEVFRKGISGEIEQVENFENEIITKNKERRMIKWYNTLTKDEEGKINGILSSGMDITDIIKMEDALKAKSEELELTNKVFVNRELKMVELKKEIEELEKRLAKYKK